MINFDNKLHFKECFIASSKCICHDIQTKKDIESLKEFMDAYARRFLFDLQIELEKRKQIETLQLKN